MRKFLLAAIGAAVLFAPAAIATTEAGAATPASHAVAATWPVVKQGAKGNRVRTIQYLLKARALRVNVDGVFGIATTTAVKSFQRAQKLAVDGHVGPATWQKLIVEIKRGSRIADAVRAVQNQLRNQFGYKTVAIDGTFGTATEKAVKEFQTKQGLKADGIVGSATWKALVSA